MQDPEPVRASDNCGCRARLSVPTVARHAPFARNIAPVWHHSGHSTPSLVVTSSDGSGRRR